ncbi:MAG: toll/interleukin-1 receptor domain-containing protein [Bacteroidetes bacterium]|nr:MAG: toll/interleukin-1 receptor domain-containing protein [Bacteroidota bacterium]
MNTKVFISHQKRDRDEAEKIAEYLKDMGINVYFDEYDRELQIATQNDNPKAVVAAIRKGINNSTHMLCIISKNTLFSKWVPFEVGYGYDKTDLATLTLKGINNSDLPDYIKVAPIIRDIYDINKFIEDKFKKKYILESRNFSDYNSAYHPLSGVMDKIIT